MFGIFYIYIYTDLINLFAIREQIVVDMSSRGLVSDFVVVLANLRARNFMISEVDKLAIQAAGRKIPKVAICASSVMGLVCLELYKVIKGDYSGDEWGNCLWLWIDVAKTLV